MKNNIVSTKVRDFKSKCACFLFNKKRAFVGRRWAWFHNSLILDCRQVFNMFHKGIRNSRTRHRLIIVFTLGILSQTTLKKIIIISYLKKKAVEDENERKNRKDREVKKNIKNQRRSFEKKNCCNTNTNLSVWSILGVVECTIYRAKILI